MARRSDVLNMAVLGLLHENPMHGYELRKRLNAVLGWSRALSYGSLYPCLKALSRRGLIGEVTPTDTSPDGAGAPALAGRRARIVYELTADGKEHFQNLLADAGPSTWEDENFGVRFAFFARTDADVRLRILEGRRSRLEERLERLRTAVQRTRERLDSYTLELHRHGLESVEREVRWLNELIDAERIETSTGTSQAATNQTTTHHTPTGCADQLDETGPGRTTPPTPGRTGFPRSAHDQQGGAPETPPYHDRKELR